MTDVVNLFPTPIFRFNIDQPLVDKTVEEIYKLKSGNSGYTGYASWQTEDDLNAKQEFSELTSKLLLFSNETLDILGVKRYNTYITNMWGNVGKPHHAHGAHIHPNNFYSGIVYLKTPAGCGRTQFYDPRQQALVIEPEYTSDTIYSYGVWNMTPKVGDIIMFPSWLQHGVENGTEYSEEDRITLAFTVMFNADIKLRTKKIIL